MDHFQDPKETLQKSFYNVKALVTINLTFFIFSNGTNSRKPSITWGNAGFPLEEQVFYWFFLFSWL